MKFHLEQFVSGKWLLVITVATTTSGISARETNAPPQVAQVVVHNIQVTSPVEYFRELLAMTPAEREKALASESPEKKALLTSKIAEYKAMSPEERELRLRMTQLRWYLVPVLKSSHAERKELLARIPAEDRVLIERRLKLWDEIPVQVQKDFLDNESHLAYLMKWRGTTPEQRAKLLETFPAARRENLERELAKWNSLPEEHREEMTARFNQFFDLDDREKSRILENLSSADRAQMETALKSLEDLPPDERKQQIDAFQRFAQLTPEERKQFLKNAERWQSMSTTERQAYRALVQKSQAHLRPPLPPGAQKAPPMPPSIAKTNSPK